MTASTTARPAGRRFDGARLRHYRTAAGLPQRVLAEGTGHVVRTVREWEQNLHTPTVTDAATVADLLGIDVNDLLHDPDPRGGERT